MNQPIVVLCTVGSDGEARGIARALVAAHLAACVNVLGPLTSIYRWEGAVQEDPEHLLVIKSQERHFEAIRETISRLHSYELPEIVALDISRGEERYLSWLAGQCEAPGD